MAKKSRKAAAKDFAKATGKQFTDTLPSLAKTASNVLNAGAELAQGNVVGAVSHGVKAVTNGVKTIAKDLKHGWNMAKNLYKAIFNDPKWWTRTGIQPSINPTRPMNPIFNTSITEDPTVGSVLKVTDIFLKWTGLYDSEMFNTIVVKYYEIIRNSVRSNLPYNQDALKQYLINAIAIKTVAAQCKRNLAFRSFSPSESPNSYKLFRKVASIAGGYGATTLRDIQYLSDENIATAIVEWNTVVDILANIVLPPYINDFIDHYFGLVFSSDKDNTNSQYITPQLSEVDYYDVKSESLTQLNSNNITISTLLNMVNDLLKTYGMIIADIKHSGIDIVSCVEPKYEQLDATVYFDKSMLQAICNAYTSSSAIQNNDYIRVDSIGDSNDLFTTFIMMGSLQSKFNGNMLNLPLLTPICMSIKVENIPELDWEQTFIQNNNLDLSQLEFFAINISTDISEDVYINYTSTGNKVTINQSGTNTTGETLVNFTANMNVSEGDFSPNLISPYHLSEAMTDSNDTVYLKVPFILMQAPGLSTGAYKVGLFIFSCSKKYDINSMTYIVNNFNFLGFSYEQYNNKLDLMTRYGSDLYDLKPMLTKDKPKSITTWSGPQFLKGITGSIGMFAPLGSGQFTQMANFTMKFTTQSFTFGSDFTIPNNVEYSFIPTVDTYMSITNIVYTTTNEAEAALSVSSGYLGMCEWLVQQLDFHIPLVVTHRYTVNIDGTSKTYTSGTNLLKESYIPYWYNIQDILPVAYAMMNSLLTPTVSIKRNK